MTDRPTEQSPAPLQSPASPAPLERPEPRLSSPAKPPASPRRHSRAHKLARDVFKPRLAVGVLLAVLFTALCWVARDALASAWSAQLQWWLRMLELTAPQAGTLSGAAAQAISSWLGLTLPRIELPAPDVGLPALLSHALAAVVTWVVAGWWPDRARPIKLLMRAAVLVHTLAIAYFFLWPASFPHALGSHATAGLRMGWLLMLLTPWLHLAIHYLLPFALWQRVALTALSLLYLALLTPLQVASHAALVSLLGPVAMPLLHLLLGVLLPVVGLVALYGWAVSWGGGGSVRWREATEGLMGAAGVSGASGAHSTHSTHAPTLSQSLPPRL
jgi:hypothetical protein